jgi:uncharacterized protein YjdB
MKGYFRHLTIFMAIVGVLIAGCEPASNDSAQTDDSIAVTGITLQETLVMPVGAERTLTADILPDNATDKSLVWASADTDVATVSADGLVTGTGLGETLVSATAVDGGHVASCTVTVNDLIIPLTGISLEDTLSLDEGESSLLIPTLVPVDATVMVLEWSSDNPAVAEVDETGSVTGLTTGTTVITVSQGEISDTCTVTVNAVIIATTSISLPPTLALDTGSEAQLSVTYIPADATNQTVIWSSGNDGIATVSSSGLVTGIADGTTDITITQGALTDICTVSVTTSVTGVTLPETLSLDPGETATLTADVEPVEASNQAVSWTSDDEDVATVDEEGLVTAQSMGSAVITATTLDGGHTDTCTVTVGGISLNRISAGAFIGGKTVTLTATAYPAGTIVWSTSDSGIATVADGVLTAVSAGTVTITATSGPFSDDCTVTVASPLLIDFAGSALDTAFQTIPATGPTALVKDDPTAAGNNVLRYGNNNYNQGFVIPVTLPAGFTLADIGTISMRIIWYSGDVGYKTIQVYGWTTLPVITSFPNSVATDLLGTVGNGVGSANTTTWKNHTVSVNTTRTDTGTIYLGINTHSGTSVWYVDDITIK